MIFKNIKPVTPSYRHLKLIKKEKELSINSPLKNKTFYKKNFSGRNNQGKITSYRKGAGVKRLQRKIDFLRKDSKGIVEKIEYDPNRTSFICRIFDFKLNSHFYILASANLKRGDYVESGKSSSLKEGNSLPISFIPIGFSIHNVSIKPNFEGQLIRSAGTMGQLIQKSKNYARIKLPSGEQRLVLVDNKATLGSLSNSNHRYRLHGKAGRSRWKNIRPSVRGVAMNPIDHPHGGGEGKTSGGRPSVTPWAKPARGQSTSKYKKKRPYIIISYKNKKSIKN